MKSKGIDVRRIGIGYYIARFVIALVLVAYVVWRYFLPLVAQMKDQVG